MYVGSRSVHLAASAEEVWALLGPFEELDSWMPGIDDLTIARTEDGSADIREVLAGGQVFVERHVRTDDTLRASMYTLVVPDLPVTDHLAVLSVTPNGPGRCAVTWAASFDVPPTASDPRGGPDAAPEQVARTVLEGMIAAFEYGLAALTEKFGPIDPAALALWDRYPDLPMDEDNVALYEGWVAEQVRMPYCGSCGRWHAVFRGRCPHCWSDDVAARPVSGSGTVHTAMRLHHGVAHPWMRYPVWVVTTELDEQDGLRRTGLLVGAEPTTSPIGRTVDTVFIDRAGAPMPAFQLSDVQKEGNA
jgi:uncharacterized OB-fold protein